MNVDRLYGALTLLRVDNHDGMISVEHDEMWVGGPNPDTMPPTVVCALEDLGFTWDTYNESWHAFV